MNMEDRYQKNKFPECIWPFTYIGIEKNGDIFLCPCRQWTSMESIGNLKEKTLRSIWNSEKAINYRKSIFYGKIKKLCNKNKCPYLISPQRIEEEKRFLTEDIKKRIRDKNPIMPKEFTRVKLDTDESCNLACKMCRTEKTIKDHNSITKLTLKKLEPHWDHIKGFCPSTSGELFFMPEIINLLKSRKLSSRDIEIEAVTNGILFTKSLWNQISHNKNIVLKVSIDSLNKKKYEMIRRGGKFVKLIKNIRYISELKKNGHIKQTQITMIIMKSNYNEIIKMIRFAKKRNIDRIKFLTLNGNLAPEEKLSKEDKEKITRLLEKPIFKDNIVDLWGLLEYQKEYN